MLMCTDCCHTADAWQDYDGEPVCTGCGSMTPPTEMVEQPDVDTIVRRLHSMRAATEGLVTRYERVLMELARLRDAATKAEANYIRYATPILEAYYEQHPPKRGKSIDLGGIKVGYRSSRGGPAVHDGAREYWGRDNEELHPALGWAMANRPDFVITETRAKLDWSGLKAVLTPDQAVPGVDWIEPAEVFFVK